MTYNSELKLSQLTSLEFKRFLGTIIFSSLSNKLRKKLPVALARKKVSTRFESPTTFFHELTAGTRETNER